MSKESGQDDATIELTCHLGVLLSRSVGLLIKLLISSATSICSCSEHSFEFLEPVREVPSSSAAAQPVLPVAYPSPPVVSVAAGLETRDQILATFEPFPSALLQGHQKLTGSSRSGEDRLCRAWRAGQWAKAVADGQVPTPNRSPALDLKSRYPKSRSLVILLKQGFTKFFTFTKGFY